MIIETQQTTINDRSRIIIKKVPRIILMYDILLKLMLSSFYFSYHVAFFQKSILTSFKVNFD